MPDLDDLPRWRAVAALAVLVLLLLWETAHPFFVQFSRDGEGWRRRGAHAARNLALGVANSLVIALLFASAWAATVHWATQHRFGLLQLVEWPGWLRAILAILVLDAWTYAWHRLNHIAPLLWRFHRLHHADRTMDVTTATRFHTVEIVLSSVLRVPVLALIGCSLEALALYEVLMFACVQFHHANIALSGRVDRVLSWFIVTPFVHKVHHSVVMTETNSNYGSLLTIWDRLFRTIRRVRDPQAIVFGVDDQSRPR